MKYSLPQIQQTSALGLFIKCNLIQMLVRRLNRIQGQNIHSSALVADPHGQFVGIQIKGKLWLVQILQLYKYFETFRKHYHSTHQYSWKEDLPTFGVISPNLCKQKLVTILVSRKCENYQYVVFVSLKSLQIVKFDNKNGQSISNTIFSLPYEIIHATMVGFMVYLTMYNLTFSWVDISKGEMKFQRNVERKSARERLSLSTPQTKKTLMRKQVAIFVEGEEEEGKLWQSAGGDLMVDGSLLGNQFRYQLDMSNSYQEYSLLQKRQYFPIKYELSPCNQYIIGCDSIKHDLIHQQSLYLIRSKMTGWSQVGSTSYKPYINPYFTYYQKYKRQLHSSNKGRNNNQMRYCKFLFAEYINEDRKVVIGLITINLWSKRKFPKQEGETNDAFGVGRVKYSNKRSKVSELINFKHRVVQIKWVGLTQMLLLCEFGQLFYIELPLEQFKQL